MSASMIRPRSALTSGVDFAEYEPVYARSMKASTGIVSVDNASANAVRVCDVRVRAHGARVCELVAWRFAKCAHRALVTVGLRGFPHADGTWAFDGALLPPIQPGDGLVLLFASDGYCLSLALNEDGMASIDPRTLEPLLCATVNIDFVHAKRASQWDAVDALATDIQRIGAHWDADDEMDCGHVCRKRRRDGADGVHGRKNARHSDAASTYAVR